MKSPSLTPASLDFCYAYAGSEDGSGSNCPWCRKPRRFSDSIEGQMGIVITKFEPLDARRSKNASSDHATPEAAPIKTRTYYCLQCHTNKPFLHDHDFFVVAWLRLLLRSFQPSSRRHN
jgi:hypothetical protein